MKAIAKIIIKDKITNKLIALKLKEETLIKRVISILQKRYEHLKDQNIYLCYKGEELDPQCSLRELIDQWGYTEKDKIEIKTREAPTPPEPEEQDYVQMIKEGGEKLDKAVLLILEETGIMERELLDSALEIAEREEQRLVTTLVKGAYLREKDILQALSEKIEVPYVNLKKKELSPETLKLVPRDICDYYCILPVEKEDNVLSIATINPFDSDKLQDLSLITGMEIEPLLATEIAIREKIEKFYGELGEESEEKELSEQEQQAAFEESSEEKQQPGTSETELQQDIEGIDSATDLPLGEEIPLYGGVDPQEIPERPVEESSLYENLEGEPDEEITHSSQASQQTNLDDPGSREIEMTEEEINLEHNIRSELLDTAILGPKSAELLENDSPSTQVEKLSSPEVEKLPEKEKEEAEELLQQAMASQQEPQQQESPSPEALEEDQEGKSSFSEEDFAKLAQEEVAPKIEEKEQIEEGDSDEIYTQHLEEEFPDEATYAEEAASEESQEELAEAEEDDDPISKELIKAEKLASTLQESLGEESGSQENTSQQQEAPSESHLPATSRQPPRQPFVGKAVLRHPTTLHLHNNCCLEFTLFSLEEQSQESLVIQAHVPGCVVTPFRKEVLPEELSKNLHFWITPLCLGKIKDCYLEISQKDKKKQVPMELSVSRSWLGGKFFLAAIAFFILGLFLGNNLSALARVYPDLGTDLLETLQTLAVQGGSLLAAVFVLLALVKSLSFSSRKKQQEVDIRL